VLFGRPAAHVEARLRHHFEGRVRIDAINPGEIDAGEAIEGTCSL